MAYSDDFRWLVLSDLKAGSTIRAVADKFKVSTYTVQSWKRQLKRKVRIVYPTKIDLALLYQDVTNYPNDFQQERAIRFNCSDRAIGKTLKRLQITHKKAIKTP